MANPRYEAAIRQAKTAGFYIREGSYVGTTDDRVGRYYIGRDGEGFRPFGPGHATRWAAWMEAATRVAAE